VLDNFFAYNKPSVLAQPAIIPLHPWSVFFNVQGLAISLQYGFIREIHRTAS
jgi:hypothetical protein